jgi:uncharacterized protein (TIRG00374 family)
MATTTRHRLLTAARILLALGLLAYLFSRLQTDFSSLQAALQTSVQHWPLWLLSLTCTFLGLLVGALRWHLILRTAGLPLPGAKVFSIFFIGQFFNSFMLGACGGDLARAYYVARAWPGKRAEAATTALIDRAVGLLVLVAFACAVIIYRFHLFFDHIGNRWMGYVMISFLGGAVALLTLLLRKNLFEHWPLFQRWEKQTALGGTFRRIYDALFLFHHHPRALAGVVLLSFLNMILLTLACVCLGQSLHVELRVRDYFTVFPVITVLSSLPLTPGGLGVREGLFVELLNTLGVAASKALPLSLLTYLGGLVWSLLGGLVFLGYSSSHGQSMTSELAAMKDTETKGAD